MIFLFRKIRKNMIVNKKVRSYLLYAFGEVFLVVIGILIAVRIDDWNEQRKKEKEVNIIMSEIQENLFEDKATLETRTNENKIYIGVAKHIETNYITIPNDSLYSLISSLHSVTGYLPVRVSFDKLSNYSTSSILPDSLFNTLTAYYATYSPEALNNTTPEGLSMYSTDKFRDYMIANGYPINTKELNLIRPKNINQLKEIIERDTFIGILRNLQHSRIVQQYGFDDASIQAENCLSYISSYLKSVKRL